MGLREFYLAGVFFIGTISGGALTGCNLVGTGVPDGNTNTNTNVNDNANGNSAIDLPAFPGAEGFGAVATGGRGGRVIYVTNLNADGPGSFQAALDEEGPRYILFKVSGLIDGEAHLTRSDVTIAGQTSPGGVIVRGFHTTEEPYCDTPCEPQQFAENWILRHIRTRPGVDGMDDGLRILHTRRAIVDHCSIANATDEAVQLSYSNDITIQNCLLAETLGDHSQYGGMLLNYSDPPHGFELTRLSIHHNCWNRLEGRLPELSRENDVAANTTMRLELSNNLMFDAGYFIDIGTTTGVAGGLPVHYAMNFVGNYYFVRSDFPYGMASFSPGAPTAETSIFMNGNRMNLYADRADAALVYCCNDYPAQTPSTETPSWSRTARHDFPEVTYVESTTLRQHMVDHVGAFPRDPMDRRLMAPVESGSITLSARNANPAGDAFSLDFPSASPPAAPTDSDDDGMPDAWETAHGLNPAVQDHNGSGLSVGLTGVAGYTNLECYLNELADSLEGT